MNKPGPEIVLSMPRQELKNVSAATARRWSAPNPVPKPGYERTVYADTGPCGDHKRRVYLANEGGRFRAWAWEEPCLLCHKLAKNW